MDAGPQGGGPLAAIQGKASQRLQIVLDKSAPHVFKRWIALVVLLGLYGLRVWLLRGFYIVTYGLGIYNLNLVLGFLTPQADPEMDGPELPTKGDQEFKPFVRRLGEMKFWFASFRSIFFGLCLTFFSVFDVPVFWPILLLYFFALFYVTMSRQIRHMIKYRYLPFSWGKKKYTGRPGERRSDKDRERDK